MKTVIIGSGNLATHLSMALLRAGIPVCEVFSPTTAHAQELAERQGGRALDSLKDVSADADIVIISVKDDAIESVVAGLEHVNNDAIFIHTAGSVPLSVLSEKRKNAAVLYPLQTFSKTKELDFSIIPCFIEATNQRALGIVKEMAEKISNRVQIADSAVRRKIHLAAVFACNMANHCYYLAEKILEEEGLDFDIMLPLIKETAEKVETLSPGKAQTGPMVRNDITVMNAQKALLSDPLMIRLYELMAESIHKSCTNR